MSASQNHGSSNTAILSLPNELLHQIILACQFHDPRAYLRLASINKRFLALVTTPYTETAFATQWISTYLRNETTPPIIEYIIRYVCFHRVPPFRCRDVECYWAPHYTVPSGSTREEIETFVAHWAGTDVDQWSSRHKGHPNAISIRWDGSFADSADLGTLVRGYTNLEAAWFIEFYERLRRRGTAPWCMQGMDTLKFGLLEILLAFYLVEGYRKSNEGRWRNQEPGINFFDWGWFESRRVLMKKKCQCWC
ncbi:hypothetical protein BJ508DRAFT_307624 [Ascobolus immersus RN42]|uniref:F-box domain-containing protein n=1 Tax=Ascobolus immersus RN42 TaxID=1160509 RepID=A0A3N4I7Z1_ASCIM|nr:hypothetical protein BJ508DRAFT_307624 [Ascobolus immersus RN42]